MYADQKVDELIKEKIKERDFATASTEMNKEYFRFGGDFEKLSMSIIYKMKIIVPQNNSKCLVLGTSIDKHYSFLRFEDP